MKFFKGLIKKDPEEATKEKILALAIGDSAINLTEEIKSDDFTLVTKVAQDLIDEGSLDGELVGQKGWFLPGFNNKLEKVWQELNKSSINLVDYSKKWGINEKRVYIALQRFADLKNQSEPAFVRDDMQVYLVAFLKKLWIDSLATFDDETPIEFKTAIDNTRGKEDVKEILKSETLKWMKEEGASHILGDDQIVRPTRLLKEYIEQAVNEYWEKGYTEITYEEIAQHLGSTRKAVGKNLQQLVSDKAFEEVTLYPIDEKLVKRDAI